MLNYQDIITQIYNKVAEEDDNGLVATYIPELAKVRPNQFGVHLTTVDGRGFGVGDYQKKFSIQSIAKIFTLTLAYKLVGDKLWERVDVEPSGTPFNSLLQLEADRGIPRNPFINAGAIVICDILVSHLKAYSTDFLKFVQEITHNSDINYSYHIAESEKAVGFRNIALSNFIKSFGNMENNPDEVLDFYFNICSLELNCEELSKAFQYLTSDNFRDTKGEKVLSSSKSKRVKAIMQTCGFYDESGEFTFRVGLPGKSGVGGGIIAIHPEKYAIAVWSPKLNPKGNSKKGMRFLELFTTETALSIF